MKSENLCVNSLYSHLCLSDCISFISVISHSGSAHDKATKCGLFLTKRFEGKESPFVLSFALSDVRSEIIEKKAALKAFEKPVSLTPQKV